MSDSVRSSKPRRVHKPFDDTYGSLWLAVVAEIHATDFLSSLVH